MIKFKLYYDKDAEEEWLKEMSFKGWAFKKFFLGFYTFEPCEPGQYNYQIDILTNWNGNKKDYSSFMEEAGVEVIGQWWRWVYLRKKAQDGPFEMYTDSHSKIEQYKRIQNFFLVVLPIEILCFFMELASALNTGSFVFGFFTGMLGVIVFALLRVIYKSRRKIEQLKNQFPS